MRIEVGSVIELKVERAVDYGYFLTNTADESVLLHHRDCTGEIEIGDYKYVFIFNDKQGRASATTNIPESMLDDAYDWAEVVSVEPNMGVFVKVGFSKDVLVSGDDLPKLKDLWPAVGDKLFITLKVDRLQRLFARLATESVILDHTYTTPVEMKNKDFNGYVYRLLKVGTFVVTDDFYRCFVHESERLEEPRLGERVKGRVIGISNEGDINGSFLPRVHERLEDDAEIIFQYLLERQGVMPYSDKSTPEEIENRFGMSKAAFKRALGNLMKQGRIIQEDGWTKAKEIAEKL